MTTFRVFRHKGATFRIRCSRYGIITATLLRERAALEAYIRRQPLFGKSLVPVEVLPDAPETAQRMAAAARLAGVGPMAAVAGAMAQRAVEAAVAAGAREAVVDNGGDVFAVVTAGLRVQLDAGDAAIGRRLALVLEPEMTPLAVCSSSSRMGHSLSLGDCDLATVVASDAALADAAATRAANMVKDEASMQEALDAVGRIEGVQGVLIVRDARVGMVGKLPGLTRAKCC